MAKQKHAGAGNFRTSDFGGPYNLSLLNVQEAEVKSTYCFFLVLAQCQSAMLCHVFELHLTFSFMFSSWLPAAGIGSS